ncbi:carboxypeptidase regulatory-like domain-containing protein [Hymenobacter sp. DG25B]|uniref:carboxypeptidase regulatory-like domain-containing protein n=1 Tax=Hymenobacter sp. DG25B TaxID=1385664 RepID=UPI0018CCA937|nr:carboxypeptidase-like regulatory domain-containing protein [Hymenobacter sp. DG25B]
MKITCGFSQTGTLKGRLFNQVEHKGFAGRATVWFPDLGIGTTTDSTGFFAIDEVPIGTHRLKIECIGYRDTTITQVDIPPCQITALNINFPIGCHVLNHRGKTCPVCMKEDQVIPIVYGLPSKRMMERAKNNKIKLAGCQITGCDPQWYCKRDEREF